MQAKQSDNVRKRDCHWVDEGTEEFQQLQLWWGMPC